MSPSLPTATDVDLIITDVDGTLLDSHHRIHAKTMNAFLKLREKHPTLPIVIASGKQYNSCQWIREALQLPPNFPAAHCNGALIYGGEHGSVIHHESLDPRAVNYILGGTERFGTFVFSDHEALLVHRGKGINDKDWCGIAGKYDKAVRDCTDVSKREEVLSQIDEGKLKVVKVTICSDESDLHSKPHPWDWEHIALTVELSTGPKGSAIELADLESQSANPFQITRAIPFIFEAIPAGITKSTALTHICALLNISPNRVLAFGDGDNDVEMFRIAGHSVAMANAMPAARAAAKHNTSSNDEGGVGEFIERIWQLS